MWAAFILLVAPIAASAQDERRSVDLTIGGTGITIGDSRRARGLRLNYRDGRLEQATGINATIWMPFKGGHGNVTGLALGIPATGAKRMDGLHVSIFGAEVLDDFTGISIAGLGLGAGGDARGFMLSGLGTGAGGNIRGVSISGLGGGAGGNVEGFAIGGFGFGAGGNVRGAVIGGLGAGVGGDVRGFAVGGFGVGAGGRVDGLMVGGLGVGAGKGGSGALIGGLGAGVGGDFDGLLVGGIGSGVGGNFSGIGLNGVGMGVGGNASGFFASLGGIDVGGTLRYVSLSGIGAGATKIEGLAATLGYMTTPHAVGVMASGLWLRVRVWDDEPANGSRDYEARLEGVGIGAFTQVLGHQHGLTIGIVNFARSLNGVQFGVINIVRDNPAGRKVLPVINWGNTRR
jgi:hypothetical protein